MKVRFAALIRSFKAGGYQPLHPSRDRDSSFLQDCYSRSRNRHYVYRNSMSIKGVECRRTYPTDDTSTEAIMATKSKKRSQRFRRKETLLKKAYEIGVLCDVDVALCLRYRKSGRLITYKSINRQYWPPTQEQMVRPCEHREHPTNNTVGAHLSDPAGPTPGGHGS
jgi:hypothetical protein